MYHKFQNYKPHYARNLEGTIHPTDSWKGKKGTGLKATSRVPWWLTCRLLLVILCILPYFCFLSCIVGVPTLKSKWDMKSCQLNWTGFYRVNLCTVSYAATVWSWVWPKFLMVVNDIWEEYNLNTISEEFHLSGFHIILYLLKGCLFFKKKKKIFSD